jgi:hypothetical protein
LEDLSSHDIGILKTKLGLDNKENSQSFRNRPNLRVGVNPDDISLADSDDCLTGNFPNEEDRRDLEKALFGEDDENSETDDEWDLPRILVSEKGPSIDKNLAKLLIPLALLSQVSQIFYTRITCQKIVISWLHHLLTLMFGKL